MPDVNWQEEFAKLVAKLPEALRPVASTLAVTYGPALVKLTAEAAWAYVQRLMAGDLTAVAELDANLSNDEYLAKVRENSAAWAGVVNAEVARRNLQNQVWAAVAPLILTLLLALVGL